MRELKFRAWDKVNKKWIKSHYNQNQFIPIDLDNDVLIEVVHDDVSAEGVVYKSWNRKEVEIMQFTGLYDKDGTEIYEGDLIELFVNKKGAVMVEFVNDFVGGWVLTHESIDQVISLGVRKKSELKVIGNIHENPELMVLLK